MYIYIYIYIYVCMYIYIYIYIYMYTLKSLNRSGPRMDPWGILLSFYVFCQRGNYSLVLETHK